MNLIVIFVKVQFISSKENKIKAIGESFTWQDRITVILKKVLYALFYMEVLT